MPTASFNDQAASLSSLPRADQSFYQANRLLVVDDDLSVRKAISDILSHCGYECDQAGSVVEALLYLEKQSYTCVLTDLLMPEKTGMDLLREITARFPEVAVILVSGQNDSGMVRKALKNGAFDYIVKPLTAAEILTTVYGALKRRESILKEQKDKHSLRERAELGMVESILFEDMVRSTIDGVMITDLENRVIMVNPAYEKLTGYTRQELLGTIPSILNNPTESKDFGRQVASSLYTTGSWSGELVDRRKGGAEWFANLTISRVKDSRGKAFADVYIVRDITDKKHMEQQLIERLKEVQSAQDAAIIGFAKLAECRDPETGVHLERMREYCRILADQLGSSPKYKLEVNEAFIDGLYKSSPLHDVGKVGIPDSILLKPGKLTAEEYEIMKTHTVIGGDALRAAEKRLPAKSFLTLGKEIAYHHHEKFDGTGYPFKFSGYSIPLSARIVAFADAYDALTSKRVYKDIVGPEESKRRLLLDRGKHFDPDVVDAFLAREHDFLQILKQFGHEN
ncbi:MAG: response regulator [Terriglobia bacterium]